MASHGVVTPGNTISVLGLILVLYGSFELYHGNVTSGLLFVLTGRFMDLLDGIVAEYTKTKSHVGEIVDTVCDKLGIIAAGLASYSSGLFSTALFSILFLHHTFTALFSILYARRYNIHTTRTGKYAMFMSWVIIILAIYSQTVDIAVFNWLTTGLTIVYAGLAVAACVSYYFALQRKIIKRMRAANWTRHVKTIIYISNPKASNYARGQRWINRIAKNIDQEKIDLTVNQSKKQLSELLKKHTIGDDRVLVAVAGGDGTVSTVANLILQTENAELIKKAYFIPLWGGNANDFATMLNGLSSQSTPHYLLARSSIVGIPTIHVELTKGTSTQTIYACGYASFGATAYAARRINQKRLADNSFIKYFPPLFILRELWSVFDALREAPVFKMSHGDKDSQHYEHTFINGSRIAKFNRVPITLSEPAFFHAAVERKHPSYIIELLRILFKRSQKQYVKRNTVKFTVSDAIDAQIDGEVYPIKPGTAISISTSQNLLYCVSTKLD